MNNIGAQGGPMISHEMIMMILVVVIMCPGILSGLGGMFGGDNSMFLIILVFLLFSGGRF